MSMQNQNQKPVRPENASKMPAVPGRENAGEKAAGKGAGKSGENPVEKGGPKGPEPTRYGDWEIGGKCVDF
jgi:hypothetical protein